MRPIKRTVNLDNSSTTKVAAAQTALINANLTLAAAASAIDSSGAARILLITTTEDDSAGNLVITGTDANDTAITETIAMPNSTTKVTTKAYKTVTTINTTLAITANISIGTVATTLTAVDKVICLDFYNRIGAVVAVEVTGTINFTVKETFDSITDGADTSATAVFFSPSAFTSKTASTVGQLDIGATGVQIVINSYSNGATLVARIISPSNSNLG